MRARALCVALLVLLGIDRWLHTTGLISLHYLRVRTVATSLAAVSLLIMIFEG